MLESQYNNHSDQQLSSYSYDENQLNETHTILQNRRKRHRSMGSSTASSFTTATSFTEAVHEHRFVGFFFTQGGPYYSQHELSLRKILASAGYQKAMTLFVVFLGGQQGSDEVFLQGTGFTELPARSVLTTLLNVTKLPTLVVIDNSDSETSTGRPISHDESLAVKWNEADAVLRSWENGKSGLSLTQKAFAMFSFT